MALVSTGVAIAVPAVLTGIGVLVKTKKIATVAKLAWKSGAFLARKTVSGVKLLGKVGKLWA